MELPAPGAGVLIEQLVDAGDTIVPGQLLGHVQAGASARPRRPASTTPAAGNGAAATNGAHGNGTTAARERRRHHRRHAHLADRRAARPRPRASTSPASPAAATAGRITVADLENAPAGGGNGSTAPRHGIDGPARRRQRARPLHGRVAHGPDRDLLPHHHRHADGRPPRAAQGRSARRRPSRT